MVKAKKDFSKVEETVRSTIADATAQDIPEEQAEPAVQEKQRKPRKTYTDEERFELLMAGKSTGCKGVQKPRINIAFDPENYVFVETMARCSGITMTALVNKAIEEYRENHAETYSKAIEFRKSL